MLKDFSKYVREHFDTNNDGTISIKEIIAGISGSAVGIAFLVVDLLVLVAEYRVWDVGIKITQDPLKAVGFVLVSAVPFYLAQVLWLYPRSNWIQQGIALVMGGTALYTSAAFGLADLSLQYDLPKIANMVIWLTVGYIFLLLVYILSDEGIRATRMKVKAKARADLQKDLTEIIRDVLADMAITQEEENKVRAEFGDDAVDTMKAALKRKGDLNPTGAQTRPKS